MPGLDAAGHQIVAGALRCRRRQTGRLDLYETALGQVVSDVFGDAVAHNHRLVHALPPEIQVAVLQAQKLVDIRVHDDVERWCLRLVENGDRVRPHLYLARREVGVHRTLGPTSHRALDLQNVFAAGDIGHGVGLGGLLGVEHHLGQPVVVPQIDKDEASVVAPAVDPTGQLNGIPLVGRAQLSAGMRFEHD